MKLNERETEINNLNIEISGLKNQVRRLRVDLEHSEEEISKFKEKENDLKDNMALYQVSCREARANSETDLKNRILSLEGELKNQRERCITIIEEKEDEVSMMKSNMETTLEAAFRAAAKTAAQTAIEKGPPMSHRDRLLHSLDSSTALPNDQFELGDTGQQILAASIVESATSSSSSFANITGAGGVQRLRRTKSDSVGKDQVSIERYKILVVSGIYLY